MPSRSARPRLAVALALLGLAACQPPPPPPQVQARPPSRITTPAAPEVPVAAARKGPAARLAEYAPVTLSADLSALSERERQALDHLIAAARHIDPIFDRQAYAGNAALAQRLAADTSPEGQATLALFRMMRGPWDRQDHLAPFVDGAPPRPPGGGFYPEDLSADAFRAHVAANPADRAAFESLTTVIEQGGDRLIARPYREVFKDELAAAAAELRAAAELTDNKSLRKFLKSRAAAFESDDYYASDKDWMDLQSPIEVTIGPYETYEDELLGLKGSFEAFVTIADPAASADLARFKARLADMEAHLPVPDELKTKRGAESPIRVVDLVFTAGDARKSVQTIAFNLPNDERVRAEKGAKKVLLRNLIRAKFDAIMRPIGEAILAPAHQADLSADAFFHQVLFHELSHSLGPAYVTVDGEKKEIRVALGAAFSPIEEAKADVMGVYNLLYMIDQGLLPAEMRRPVLVSYFAGLFRSVRFGTAEAHGLGAAFQLGRFAEAAVMRIDGGKITLDLDALEREIGKLTGNIIQLQALGSPDRAQALLDRYRLLPVELQALIGELGSIPVDVRPVYPLAGEGGAG